jgi:hypothetical protein
MAITQAMCTSFKVELLNGVHKFDGTQTFKVALYTSSTTLDATTTTYGTPTNEVAAGGGYTTGGNTLTISTSPTTGGTTAYLSFANSAWASATFTARGALIYNSTASNKAVAVLDFGADKSVTASTFTVQMPTADATNAIIRIA